MKTFYTVMLLAFVAGMIILCCVAPWTSTPVGISGAHNSLGYASVWSQRFAAVSGSRVDPGPFAILTGVVAFFAIVIGAAAYFFRDQRGPEKDLDDD
jgi:hypothetical protein